MTESSSTARPDDDDYDLLTYGEAGVRLRLEIDRQESRLADLSERAGVDQDELENARQRLADLREAALRHETQRVTSADFERFFGYSSGQLPT
jgi:cell division FtsZ-interacting protein ZapD